MYRKKYISIYVSVISLETVHFVIQFLIEWKHLFIVCSFIYKKHLINTGVEQKINTFWQQNCLIHINYLLIELPENRLYRDMEVQGWTSFMSVVYELFALGHMALILDLLKTWQSHTWSCFGLLWMPTFYFLCLKGWHFQQLLNLILVRVYVCVLCSTYIASVTVQKHDTPFGCLAFGN